MGIKKKIVSSLLSDEEKQEIANEVNNKPHKNNKIDWGKGKKNNNIGWGSFVIALSITLTSCSIWDNIPCQECNDVSIYNYIDNTYEVLEICNEVECN